MRKKRTMMTVLIMSICAVIFSVVMVGCGPVTEEPEYAFVFSGSGKIGDVDYNVKISGAKETKTFVLSIAELPAIELTGTYEFDSSKGYRLTFGDNSDTVKVPKYNTATKLFSFVYELNLGTNYGKGDITFTYKNESFTPGSETFFEPFSFVGGTDYGEPLFFGMADFNMQVTLYEDNTCSATGECSLAAVNGRSGTWSYDSTENAYSFIFGAMNATYDNDTYNKYTAKYDEDIKSYSFKLHLYVPASSYFGYMTVSYMAN